MKVLVLGAGLVGNLIARDLAEDFDVTIVDINEQTLAQLKSKYNIKGIQADLSDTKRIKEIVKDYDLIVGALPGFMGYKAIKAVLEAGKNIVDISFFPEDPFSLDEIAKENNVSVLIDCGVAPGLSNIILGHAVETLEEVESFVCYVGGLPVERTLPWQYKAPFSPIDVIEEYTRPARIVENGKIVEKEALSESELLWFPNIGTLEAFNTDGLRTVLQTIKVPNMKEKTLRYPGHIDYIKFLKEIGLFNTEKINLKDCAVSPIELTSKVLINQWQFREDEEDLTVMRIIISGKKDSKTAVIQYDLFDRYDKQTHAFSMARTTGYTCTAVVRYLVKNDLPKGLITPEELGKREDAYQFIINELKKRNVKITEIAISQET